MAHLGQLVRERGIRRRVIKLRPIKATLNERRALQAIINEMVNVVFRYRDELIEAASTPTPRLIAVDTGETIGTAFNDAWVDLDRLLQLIILQTQQVMVRLEARVREWGEQVNERHNREFTEGILTATTIDVATRLHPTNAAETVEDYVRWAVSLIRDVGEDSRRRIERIVLDGVRNRVPPRELARQLTGIEGISRRRAKNIAADQANKLNNALDRARQEEAGIDHFTWRHSGKVHFRPHHKSRSGKVYEWGTSKIRRGDFPGEPPYCGCVAQATIIQEDAE